MSFLNEIVKRKERLKTCDTVVTSIAGNKYLEKKTETGDVKIQELPQRSFGFVVDNKLDLQIAEILEYLYLSSQDAAQDIDLLKKKGITHVLSVGVKLSTPLASEIQFKAVDLLDEPEADLSQALNFCFEFIENCRLESEKNKVLVHCNAGYSRAPTVVIAYLIIKLGYSLDKSFDMVNSKRKIKPNEGFMAQLRKLDKNVKD